MTARLRIQGLIKACALLPALLLALGGRATGLEVLGGPEPTPLLLADHPQDLAAVAGSLGRMVFENAPHGKNPDSDLQQTVVTATLITPVLLLTTAHAFYETDGPGGVVPGQLPRAKMRAVCRIERETRDHRWVSCRSMHFLPAFAPNTAETGERSVSQCVHFAAYPGADGLAQEAICVLSQPAALATIPLPLSPHEAIDTTRSILVPFMAQRRLQTQDQTQEPRWDGVVGEACAVVIDRSVLRPGSFAGPSGHALRHYCAIWAGGSGAPLVQETTTGAGLEIIGVHLGERYAKGDIARQQGDRRFVAPHRFKGRTANVAVSTARLHELLSVIE